jgi:hypothetical protein
MAKDISRESQTTGLFIEVEDIYQWYLTWERVDTGAEDLHAQV